jgi:hypothetical protein
MNSHQLKNKPNQKLPAEKEKSKREKMDDFAQNNIPKPRQRKSS